MSLQKVEIIHNVDAARLQSQVNEFLSTHEGIEVIDINYQHVVDQDGDAQFSVLILYKV